MDDSATSNGTDGPDAPLELPMLGEAAQHDEYVRREEATAIRPDGSLALLTNIDPAPEERAKFWSLIERHEAVASPDEMSLRVGDRPEFWARVVQRPDCPRELRAAIAEAPPEDTIRFKVSSGKALRRFLSSEDGSVKPGSPSRDESGNVQRPFAKFHDGRKGRTQYRVVGELPDELEVEERFKIVEAFSAVFAERRLPFVAVMHAPDQHNDERNWHFHLIYHDRPARRIKRLDIEALDRQGFNTNQLEPGQWDFAVATPKRHRSNGRATPLKQNKDREVTSKGWLGMLRHELADITNERLAAAGIARRVDPRTFAEMGILADPQEHLGTKQSALETHGGVTPTGIANEQRQWGAILAAADARLETELAILQGQHTGSFAKGATGFGVRSEQELEAAGSAVDLEHAAFRLEQSIRRARSRAQLVERTNNRLLHA